jgi:hypothetical protein
VNPDLEDLTTTQILTPDSHILIMVDDALDQVF